MLERTCASHELLIGELRHKESKAEAEQREIQRESHSQKFQLEVAAEQTRHLEDANRVLGAQATTLEAVRRDLGRRLAKQLAQCEDQSEEIKYLRQLYTKTKRESLVAQQELAGLRITYDSAYLELEAAKHEVRQRKHDHAVQSLEVHQARNTREQVALDARDRLARAEYQKEFVQGNHRKVAGEKQSLVHQVAQLETKLANMKDEVEEQRKKRDQLQASNTELANENELLAVDAAGARTRIESLTESKVQQAKIFRKQKKKMKTELNQLQMELEDHSAQARRFAD